MAAGDFQQSILDHVTGTHQDGQLVGELIEHKPDFQNERPDHFYLTDLTNPQASYWDHVGLSPEHSERQLDLFAHGDRMEAVIRSAFSNLSDFAEAESTLDGAENGIPGVRGKVDFRYLDSLVEFKTSEFDIDSPEDIWDFAPQDIEQLLFYTALWTHDNDTHYLMYMSENDPDCLRVFNVGITDPVAIRSELESRKSILTGAIDEEDPSDLGQCRYFDHSCHIQEEGLCTCASLGEVDTSPLEDATHVERDAELEHTIRIALRANEDRWGSVGSWDLYTPRQWYLEETGRQDSSNEYLTPKWVYDALRSANLTPGPLTDIDYPRIEGSVVYSPRINYVRRIRTTGLESTSEWVPTKIVAKDWPTTPSSESLRSQFMQIACASAIAGKDKGLVILELPNASTEVDAHEIQLRDIDGIRRKVQNRLESIEEAIQNEDPALLPACSDWVQDFDCENCLCG